MQARLQLATPSMQGAPRPPNRTLAALRAVILAAEEAAEHELATQLDKAGMQSGPAADVSSPHAPVTPQRRGP